MNCFNISFKIKPIIKLILANLKSNIPDDDPDDEPDDDPDDEPDDEVYDKLIQLLKDNIQHFFTILKILQDNNCYDAEEYEDFVKEKKLTLRNQFRENVYNYYKDPIKRKKFFSDTIINPIIEELKNKRCFLRLNFNKQKNDFLNSEFNTNRKNIKNNWDKLEDILNTLQKSLQYQNNQNNQNRSICFEIYKKLNNKLLTLKTLNTRLPVDNNTIKFVLEDINTVKRVLEDINPQLAELDHENNKNCFDIKKLLEKKLEKTNIGKDYITFECFTCNSLKDCAKIINQQLKLSSALK